MNATGLGDDLVPDYITRVKEGGFYGWPWYYMGNYEDPRHAGERPDLAGKGHRAGRVVAGTLGLAGNDFLYGHHRRGGISRGISRGHFCRLSRLMESNIRAPATRWCACVEPRRAHG